MFSVVNGVLLRPLPYPEQERLIDVVHQAPGLGIGRLYASSAIYFTYADHNRTFDGIAHWDWDKSPVTVSGSGEPEAVQSLEVTHEALSLLGGEPILGRRFTAEDDRPGSPPTAIISHGYWQRKLGGADPLGQTLVVDGVHRARSSGCWPRRSASSGIRPTSSTRSSPCARRPASPRSTAAPSPDSRKA